MKYSLNLMVFLILISGCSKGEFQMSAVNDNPTAKDIMTLNHDADIFISDGYVFSNAENLAWIRDQGYELGEQIGEIKKQTAIYQRFKEWTASKLPVGTKIFETNAPFYIAIVNGKEIPYIKLVEG
jgi:hypothetical protein